MNASGSLLAQVRPSVTTAVLGFTASMVTEITRIEICNTDGTAHAASLFHDNAGGSTFDQTTALRYAKNVPANDAITIESNGPNGGIMLKSGAQLGIQTNSANNLTFSIYGITQKVSYNV